MGQSQIRKIKEVNGWKVNHPQSAAKIVYTIFALLLTAAPLSFLFLPTAFIALRESPFTVFLDYGYKGIDLIKEVIKLITYMINGEIDHASAFMANLTTVEWTGEILNGTIPYVYIVQASLLALLFIFSIVTLILFLVNLIRGFLRHSGAIKVFAALDFIVALLYSLSLLIIYFGFNYSEVGTESASYALLNVWVPFIITGGYMFLLIIISAIHGVAFKDSIPEDELEFHEESPTVEHVSKVHEVTKVKYEGSSTLPPNLTSIGGHAFAENQNLVVANVPPEVTKLGNSAFANCLHLRVVSLPNTITEIGYNCFFNCVELERINYAGTKDEWKKISRGSNWLSKAKTTEVVCSDGAIIVNPYH